MVEYIQNVFDNPEKIKAVRMFTHVAVILAGLSFFFVSV